MFKDLESHEKTSMSLGETGHLMRAVRGTKEVYCQTASPFWVLDCPS